MTILVPQNPSIVASIRNRIMCRSVCRWEKSGQGGESFTCMGVVKLFSLGFTSAIYFFPLFPAAVRQITPRREINDLTG